MLDKMEAKKQEIMVASFLIASTAALRGSRDVVTDSFEQKFGPPNEDNTDVVQE